MSPGIEPVLCVELLEGEKRASRAAVTADLLELAARHAHTRGIRNVLYHPGFPVDIRHNAKIGRSELARWAARQLRAPAA